MAKQKKSSSVVVDLCRDKRDPSVYVIFHGSGKRPTKKNSFDSAVGIWRAAGLRRTLLDIDVVKVLFPGVDISPGDGPVRLQVDVTFAGASPTTKPSTEPLSGLCSDAGDGVEVWASGAGAAQSEGKKTSDATSEKAS